MTRFFRNTPHFDFQVLRQEGLKHIGDLSGKIWTDHNTHDPGVTILEVLCYALIDLGYRTLPMEDLLAEPRITPTTGRDADRLRHENFFTPLEILSCEFITIVLKPNEIANTNSIVELTLRVSRKNRESQTILRILNSFTFPEWLQMISGLPKLPNITNSLSELNTSSEAKKLLTGLLETLIGTNSIKRLKNWKLTK